MTVKTNYQHSDMMKKEREKKEKEIAAARRGLSGEKREAKRRRPNAKSTGRWLAGTRAVGWRPVRLRASRGVSLCARGATLGVHVVHACARATDWHFHSPVVRPTDQSHAPPTAQSREEHRFDTARTVAVFDSFHNY